MSNLKRPRDKGWGDIPKGSPAKRSRPVTGISNESDSDDPDGDAWLEPARPRRGGFRTDVYGSDDDEDLYYDQRTGDKDSNSTPTRRRTEILANDEDENDTVEDVTVEEDDPLGRPKPPELAGFGLQNDSQNTQVIVDAQRAREARAKMRQQPITEDLSAVDDTEDYAYQPSHGDLQQLTHTNAPNSKGKQPEFNDDDKHQEGADSKPDMDDDDDMFAPQPDTRNSPLPEKEAIGAESQPDQGFLNRTDIVGQVLDSRNVFDDQGQQVVEAFHMNEEMAEGDFDAEGNYIRKSRDPLAFHDQWLNNVTKSDIELARQAQRRQEQRIQQREQQSAHRAQQWTRPRTLLTLLELMQPRESVTRTLARLGKSSKPRKSNRGQSGKSSATDTSPRDTQTIELITELCDQMMALGDFNIYQTTYEQMVRELRGQGLIPESWIPGTPLKLLASTASPTQSQSLTSTSPKAPATLWDYRYSVDTPVFEQFTWSDIMEWYQQGYFTGDVLVKTHGDPSASFCPLKDLLK
ncbi:hypothetical protein IWQ62_002212 [Dispira parvispora]|uniref:GYF domain-containing protein n=1 Tax=Dispira parvispora TaxID=1520584 RepID=A0A9W8AUB3_9FUNG|nr:hypothetical protein IWQ62_002212 [Dispira parvispora]